MNKVFSLIFLLTVIGVRAHAQNDPVLAGMIVKYTDKAEKELKAQEEVMLMQSTGHIWTKEELVATTKLHKEFNSYLDSFRSIVVYAAQIYGFYHEIDRMVNNLSSVTNELKSHPDNALAVALSSQRNKIYRELIMQSVDIVNDIRLVCLSDNKMTEKERVDIVFAIRPKLTRMNPKLMRLTKAVKYTSMADVWNEIDEGSRPAPANKKEIVERAKRDWRQTGKNVRP